MTYGVRRGKGQTYGRKSEIPYTGAGPRSYQHVCYMHACSRERASANLELGTWDLRGAMMDMYTRMCSQTCQSSSVSQIWRTSKCSSSPTDELSYSARGGGCGGVGGGHNDTLRQKRRAYSRG